MTLGDEVRQENRIAGSGDDAELDDKDNEDDEPEESLCLKCDLPMDHCLCANIGCPFCYAEALDGDYICVENIRCPHIVAGWDDGGGFVSPFRVSFPAGAPPIVLPVLPTGLDVGEVSDEHMCAMLGENANLLDAFDEPGDPPSTEHLARLLMEQIPNLKAEAGISSNIEAMVSTWSIQAYFAEEPDGVRADIERRIAELTSGMERLAAYVAVEQGTT